MRALWYDGGQLLTDRGRALLAYVDEIAAGLTASARTALIYPHIRRDDRTTAEDDLVEAGLLQCCRVGCSHELCPLDLTPLGHEVARVLGGNR
jgi:hypothetical protein